MNDRLLSPPPDPPRGVPPSNVSRGDIACLCSCDNSDGRPGPRPVHASSTAGPSNRGLCAGSPRRTGLSRSVPSGLGPRLAPAYRLAGHGLLGSVCPKFS
jgi:hypothetical protein